MRWIPTPRAPRIFYLPVLATALLVAGVGQTGAETSGYQRHATLGWFALGSWSLAGILYGLEANDPAARKISKLPNKDFHTEQGDLRMAIGASVMMGVVSGLSYLYYADSGRGRYPWDAIAIPVETSPGRWGVAARIHMGYPAL